MPSTPNAGINMKKRGSSSMQKNKRSKQRKSGLANSVNVEINSKVTCYMVMPSGCPDAPIEGIALRFHGFANKCMSEPLYKKNANPVAAQIVFDHKIVPHVCEYDIKDGTGAVQESGYSVKLVTIPMDLSVYKPEDLESTVGGYLKEELVPRLINYNTDHGEHKLRDDQKPIIGTTTTYVKVNKWNDIMNDDDVFWTLRSVDSIKRHNPAYEAKKSRAVKRKASIDKKAKELYDEQLADDSIDPEDIVAPVYLAVKEHWSSAEEGEDGSDWDEPAPTIQFGTWLKYSKDHVYSGWNKGNVPDEDIIKKYKLLAVHLYSEDVHKVAGNNGV